ncbi:MAG TPA: RNase adapter RapZ [Candidatus Binatia bacterium]|nr:RNase adapter RapZ [Candidatus Binatia bacterium]
MTGEAPTASWILTGMSGAGKATAARALELAGAEVTDNLSPELLDAWAGRAGRRPAVAVIDSRQGEAVRAVLPPPGIRVLFLTAPDPVLVRRLAESTRPHPCAAAGTLEAIAAERALLTALRAGADAVIDTGEIDPAELGRRVTELIAPQAEEAPLRITVSSFGYKFGPQPEADWVIDVRFLRNPFWEAELRPLSGLDEAVRAYVLADPRAEELQRRLVELLGWVAAQYAGHRRRLLHVAVGCTGGRHRSVVMAEELGRRLRSERVEVVVRHRDAAKIDPR